jgi:endonuclease YncB( thermonuclease family)
MFRYLTILFLATVVFPATSAAQQFVSFYGEAVDVFDGDMFTIQLKRQSGDFLVQNGWLTQMERITGRVVIQLQGIDAPERNKNDPYWRESRAHLASRLSRQLVNIQTMLTPRGINRSGLGGPIVGVARIGSSSEPLNLSLIEVGLAKDDWDVSFGGVYVAAQKQAMSRRVGIWSDPLQYERENNFRIGLYGNAGSRNKITVIPYPKGKFSRNGKPETRKSPFPNVGVGKQEWQK